MAHLSGFRRATLVIALSVAALSLVAVTPADGDVQAIHSMTEAELAEPVGHDDVSRAGGRGRFDGRLHLHTA